MAELSKNTSDVEIEKLDNLVKKTNREIFSVSSVFPFDLFPDTIRVDENKVDIIHREFFIERHIFPILLGNINAVTIQTNLLFATLRLEVTGYETNPEPVHLLPYNEAIRAKRIITGLVTCFKQGIDVSKIPLDELRRKTEEIGRSREVQMI